MYISLQLIVVNKRMVYFTIIKIIYNIHLAFELYIEERGKKRMNNFDNCNKYKKNINQKIIFPLII